MRSRLKLLLRLKIGNRLDPCLLVNRYSYAVLVLVVGRNRVNPPSNPAIQHYACLSSWVSSWVVSRSSGSCAFLVNCIFTDHLSGCQASRLRTLKLHWNWDPEEIFSESQTADRRLQTILCKRCSRTVFLCGGRYYQVVGETSTPHYSVHCNSVLLITFTWLSSNYCSIRDRSRSTCRRPMMIASHRREASRVPWLSVLRRWVRIDVAPQDDIPALQLKSAHLITFSNTAQFSH